MESNLNGIKWGDPTSGRVRVAPHKLGTTPSPTEKKIAKKKKKKKITKYSAKTAKTSVVKTDNMPDLVPPAMQKEEQPELPSIVMSIEDINAVKFMAVSELQAMQASKSNQVREGMHFTHGEAFFSKKYPYNEDLNSFRVDEEEGAGGRTSSAAAGVRASSAASSAAAPSGEPAPSRGVDPSLLRVDGSLRAGRAVRNAATSQRNQAFLSPRNQAFGSYAAPASAQRAPQQYIPTRSGAQIVVTRREPNKPIREQMHEPMSYSGGAAFPYQPALMGAPQEQPASKAKKKESTLSARRMGVLFKLAGLDPAAALLKVHANSQDYLNYITAAYGACSVGRTREPAQRRLPMRSPSTTACLDPRLR